MNLLSKWTYSASFTDDCFTCCFPTRMTDLREVGSDLHLCTPHCLTKHVVRSRKQYAFVIELFSWQGPLGGPKRRHSEGLQQSEGQRSGWKPCFRSSLGINSGQDKWTAREEERCLQSPEWLEGHYFPSTLLSLTHGHTWRWCPQVWLRTRERAFTKRSQCQEKRQSPQLSSV